MALAKPKKSESVRIAVFDHALPHRILITELQAQRIANAEDIAIVERAEEAYRHLETAKNALDDWSTVNPGLPIRGSQQEHEQNEHLEKVRQANGTARHARESSPMYCVKRTVRRCVFQEEE